MNRKIFKKMAELEERLSWTTHPTEPVLPPYGYKLMKVTGVVERIYVERLRNYFSPKEYRIAEFENDRAETMGGIVAILGALAGQSAMGARSGRKLDLERLSTQAYFVNIQIDGVVYRGWVGACPFQPGDEVELAVEWQDDHYEVYAITRPKDKIISICPKCDKGKREYIKELFLEVAFMLLILSLFFGTICSDSKSLLDIHAGVYFGILAAFGFVLAVYSLKFFFEFNTLFNTNVRLAGLIFNALEFKDSDRINLKKITKKRIKQIYKETGVKSTVEFYEQKPIICPLSFPMPMCHLYYYE